MQDTALTSDQATESADLPVCCLDEDWSLDEVQQPETFASAPVKKFVLVDLPDDVFARAPVAPVETRTTQSTPVEVAETDAQLRPGRSSRRCIRQGAADTRTSHPPGAARRRGRGGGGITPAGTRAGAARRSAGRGGSSAVFRRRRACHRPEFLPACAAAQIPAPACVAAPGSATQADLARAAALAAPVAREAAAATRAESPPRRLGDAVDLTRRAVSAWVSVLIGPALVDVPRR